MSLDFNKLREENKKRAEAASKTATVIVQKEQTLADRVSHLIKYHLGEMTEWEANFCYSQRDYCQQHPNAKGTENIQAKVAEMEAAYCGSICHALNKSGIGHG